MKNQILYLGNQLSKHGFNKTTIETLGFQLEMEGLSIFYSSDKKSLSIRMLAMISAVFKYRKRIEYILIDTYSTKAFWYSFVCSQLARFFKIKYIPILHGGDLPNRLKTNPKLCQIMFANAYRNVAPSGYLKQAFEQKGYANIIYIPNSIEIQKYKFKKRTDFTPKLLWVRAFDLIYNPEMAVKVLFELQKTFPNASLTMVGPDKDGSLNTTKFFAESLGVTVNFTGQLSKEAWRKLALEHDFFINTSNFDNTPVSVMEAMALGLPIVSTNVGGIPYLLNHKATALLVSANDVDQMTNSILYLITNSKNTIVMAQNARRKIEKMDWEVVKRQWIRLIG